MTYFPLNFKEQTPRQKHDKKLRRFNLTMKCSSNYAHNVSAGLRHLLSSTGRLRCTIECL